MLYTAFDQLVGHTPLLALDRLGAALGLKARVLAKLEYCNPAGSAKDRAALYMLNAAEEAGLLQPGGTVIEPTSGNTGIGLAAAGVPRGYRVIIVMPDNMSAERVRLMAAYGAELVLTPGAGGMTAAIEKARELQAQYPGSVLAGQFENPANARAHYETTGPEIWADCGGKVDLFVAGVGTGGTITGVGRYLKEQDSGVEVIAVEPAGSPVLSGGKAGSHGIQGIGGGFVPELLDTGVYDRIAAVTEEQAYAAGRLLARKEGILAGISSGAALHAALEEAKKEENAGKQIVVLLPDTGDRYLSTPLFAD